VLRTVGQNNVFVKWNTIQFFFIFYVQVRSDMKLIFVDELYAVQHTSNRKTVGLVQNFLPSSLQIRIE
jgi:hypothetical protein